MVAYFEEKQMVRRFDSQFDPEELSRITHKGLKPRQKSSEPRVSEENKQTLKQAQQNEDKLSVRITRMFAAFFGSIASAVKGLFTPRAKKVMQCETYGHVMKPGWTGPHPKCIDCGAAILTLDQVRGATPKADRQDISGKQTFQQTDRKYVK